MGWPRNSAYFGIISSPTSHVPLINNSLCSQNRTSIRIQKFPVQEPEGCYKNKEMSIMRGVKRTDSTRAWEAGTGRQVTWQAADGAKLNCLPGALEPRPATAGTFCVQPRVPTLLTANVSSLWGHAFLFCACPAQRCHQKAPACRRKAIPYTGPVWGPRGHLGQGGGKWTQHLPSCRKHRLFCPGVPISPYTDRKLMCFGGGGWGYSFAGQLSHSGRWRGLETSTMTFFKPLIYTV